MGGCALHKVVCVAHNSHRDTTAVPPLVCAAAALCYLHNLATSVMRGKGIRHCVVTALRVKSVEPFLSLSFYNGLLVSSQLPPQAIHVIPPAFLKLIGGPPWYNVPTIV